MNSEPYYIWNVYAISDGVGNVKFGVAMRSEDRKKDLQVGNAYPLQVLFEVACQKPASTRDWECCREAAYRVERIVHRWLKEEGRQTSGEWFSVSYHEALDVLSQASMMNTGRLGHLVEVCNVEIVGPIVLIQEDDHIYWPIPVHAQREAAQ